MKRPVPWPVTIVTTLSLLVGAIAFQASSGSAQPSTQQEFLATLSRAAAASRWLSGAGRVALNYALGPVPHIPTRPKPGPEAPVKFRPGVKPFQVAAGPADVRVNHPAGDGAGNPDMTTQSETSVAAFGSNVVVAYNDDGHSSPFLTPAIDFSGYSYSSDGGAHFTDSQLPNKYPTVNLGDPVVGVDRSGRFYYASLGLDVSTFSIPVVVGTSTNGGAKFSLPTNVSGTDGFFSMADKPWLAVGPNRSDPSQDTVYVGWNEFFFDCPGGQCDFGTAIKLTRSEDGGATWTAPVTVAEQPGIVDNTESFVTGTGLGVDSNGRLYVAYERFGNPLSNFSFDFPNRDIFVTRSDDGGDAFGTPVLVGSPSPIGAITSFFCSNTLNFGPGRDVRVQEFPTLAVAPSGEVFVTFNSNVLGTSEVFVARSTNRGKAWKIARAAPAAPSDTFMPSITADASGVRVLFYERVSRTTLAAAVSTSADGATFTSEQVSHRAFRVPLTDPQTDPVIASCYMGDYVGMTSAGGNTYMAWGDNRDVLTNGFWLDGRVDPDVYFATR